MWEASLCYRKKELREQLLRWHRRPLTHNQLPVTTATQEDKGRQQTLHRGWWPQLSTSIWSRCLGTEEGTEDLGVLCNITDLLKGHSHRICNRLSVHISPFISLHHQNILLQCLLSKSDADKNC